MFVIRSFLLGDRFEHRPLGDAPPRKEGGFLVEWDNMENNNPLYWERETPKENPRNNFSNKRHIWSLISLIFIVIFGFSFMLPSLMFPRIIFAVLALIFGIIGWKKKENKIFTLTIIILSSLVLIFSIYLLIYVMGPGATEKRKIAQTANVKLFMNDLNISALLYYSNNKNSYMGLDNDSNTKVITKSLMKYGGKEFNIYISPDGKEFCSEILLPDKSFQCIDDARGSRNYRNNPKCSSNYYFCE